MVLNTRWLGSKNAWLRRPSHYVFLTFIVKYKVKPRGICLASVAACARDSALRAPHLLGTVKPRGIGLASVSSCALDIALRAPHLLGNVVVPRAGFAAASVPIAPGLEFCDETEIAICAGCHGLVRGAG
jgi:hypothetical protein